MRYQDAKIKKMTKHRDLKNEIKKSWKVISLKIPLVIIKAGQMMKKNLTETLKTMPRNITTNKLQLEAVRSSVTILKRALGTKL